MVIAYEQHFQRNVLKDSFAFLYKFKLKLVISVTG